MTSDDEHRELVVLKYGQSMEKAELLTKFEGEENGTETINKLYKELDALEAHHAKQLVDLEKKLNILSQNGDT